MGAVANLTASGLQLSNNQLNNYQGALNTAKNVIIRRDNVIESRRGYKLYGNAFGSSSARAKQLKMYRNRLLRHYSNILQYDNGSGTFTSFNTQFTEAKPGVRFKSIESNGNLYLTSSEGIKKISASSASDFNPNLPITKAGGVKALDFTADANYEFGNISSFLPKDSQCAYRILWASKDKNNNLILGSPSARVVVYNPFQTLIMSDFNRLLKALDDISSQSTPGVLRDGNYINTYYVYNNTSGTTLHTYLNGLCTKLDNDLILANDNGAGGALQINNATANLSTKVITIQFTTDPSNYFSIGDQITSTGFNVAEYNGNYTILSVNPSPINTITYKNDSVNNTSSSYIGAKINSREYTIIASTHTTPPSIPTNHNQWQDLQNWIDKIITRLQIEKTGVIGANGASITANLGVTNNSSVTLKIQIPDEITDEHFLQVYRSEITTASGTMLFDDLSPSDELQLIYEAYPTESELDNNEMIVVDDTPDAFRGANLYTNQISGEGILQSNDAPPFAIDINRFKGYTFYANTKTKQRMTLNILGISAILEAIDNGKQPEILIANETQYQRLVFVKGVKERTKITTVGDSGNSLNGKYFDINSAYDKNKYRVYYNTGTDTPPSADGRTLVKVNISTNANANTVAEKTAAQLRIYNIDFNVSLTNNEITIENVTEGQCVNASQGTTGFTITILQNGAGEDATSNPVKVLASNETSPSLATDLTARSLVKMINHSLNNFVQAYYLSSITDVPGKILLESINLSDSVFYVTTNMSDIGVSFNPNISPLELNKSASVANPTVISSTNHGLNTGDKILVSTPSNSTITPAIFGIYEITKINNDSFTINVNVTVSGNINYTLLSDANYSSNEAKVNRIYYSKYYQPEAVPIVNYFDVGAEGEEIIRIFPLRDSLFVFKKDGLYRVSGEVPPWNVTLFDSSCIVAAPDTVDVANNVVYAYTTQGIATVTESSVQIISRPIDVEILKLFNPNYINFQTATFGIGYESDNSYTVYTIQKPGDNYATIGYRFSNLTNTWTTFDKTATCGIVSNYDDKQYLGAGDTNHIEQERKNFDRTDYCDREIVKSLPSSAILGNKQCRFAVVSDLSVGDVIVQQQYVTIAEFNSLLKMLDVDSGVNDNDYFSLLQAKMGDNMTAKLQLLAQKLDADTGVTQNNFEASLNLIDTSYLGIKNNYNIIVNKLNADATVSFNTYPLNQTSSLMEMIIKKIDPITKIVTVDVELPIYEGNVTIYKAIDCVVQWSPNGLGNVTELKHAREVQVFLETRAITEGKLLFNTDLFPLVSKVQVTGDGSGLYGIKDPFGTKNYFGGSSNTAPIRTYIPRNYQRFAYITIGWEHQIAREKWALFGISVIGETTGSNRAWR